MRVGIVADVHIGLHKKFGGPVVAGLNRRAQLALATLKAAQNEAIDLDCERFVVAGDLVDYISVEPQLMRALQLALTSEIATYVMRGNHDMVSAVDGDHALGPLAAVPNVAVIETPQTFALDHGAELVIVPFQPGDARVWLPEVLEKIGPQHHPGNAGKPRILVIHLGLIDDSTPEFLRGAHDAIPVKQLARLANYNGYDTVVAGNWHSYKKWQTRSGAHLVQIGALVPTGFDNPGMRGYGTLLVYDTDSPASPPERHEIPGPRFVVARTQDEVFKAATDREDNHVFLRWDVGPELSLKECSAYIDSEITAGRLEGGIAVTDTGDSAAGAREGAAAAAAASNGVGGEDVLAAYVAAMEIPEGVARESVLASSRRLLTSARVGRG